MFLATIFAASAHEHGRQAEENHTSRHDMSLLHKSLQTQYALIGALGLKHESSF
jgi:hypothetical protein